MKYPAASGRRFFELYWHYDFRGICQGPEEENYPGFGSLPVIKNVVKRLPFSR